MINYIWLAYARILRIIHVRVQYWQLQQICGNVTGCGKTMIAKATAREAGARFVNLDAAALHDKWYGESQKLAGAVFTLAQKIQPCIIFIDEIDSLLRVRDSHDHEATAMIKSQFMQLWDGLATDDNCTVVVMGATNRPKDVDRAILRRMPATFHIGLPDAKQRRSILAQVLRIENVDEDVDLDRLSGLSEGFSGSDLRELCRTASVYRVKDYVRGGGGEGTSATALRSIVNDDLLKALGKMRESKIHCGGASVLNSFTLD
jgi:SpoVK/Ycf46/Vps4 family AAA+-type ATPase